MQGCKNEKLDKWDVKEEHSLKKQHKLSQFGSESKIFVRDIPEIPFNYLPWILSKSRFFVWASLLFLNVQKCTGFSQA